MRTISLLSCLSLLACSSIDYAGRGDPDRGIAVSTNNYSALSQNISLERNLKSHCREDILVAKEPKAFKDFVCKNNKIIKRRVTAILPNFSGMPLAKAAQFQEDCRSHIRDIAKTFYGRSVFECDSEMPFYVSGNGLSTSASIDKLRDLSPGDGCRLAFAPVFYPSRNEMFLYPMNVFGVRWENVPSHDLGRYNLQQSRQMELTTIFENFTPVLPDDVLNEVMHGEDSSTIADCEARQILNGGDAQMCWSYVFNFATSVKESVRKGNPNVIDFDVTLDLDLFCKYGRPNSDLVSK